METLTSIFAHVCGQGRCLVVDGTALPVCERCTGLYLGALLAAMWVLAQGVWRRGLPSLPLVCAQAGTLVVALLGGLHVLDFGPGWRLLCGMWTGEVAVLWLVNGVTQLQGWRRATAADRLAWSFSQSVGGWIAVFAPVPLAVLSAALPRAGWYAWSGAITAGAIALALVILWTAIAIAWVLAGLARGRGVASARDSQ